MKNKKLALNESDMDLLHFALDILEMDHPDDHENHRETREHIEVVRDKLAALAKKSSRARFDAATRSTEKP